MTLNRKFLCSIFAIAICLLYVHNVSGQDTPKPDPTQQEEPKDSTNVPNSSLLKTEVKILPDDSTSLIELIKKDSLGKTDSVIVKEMRIDTTFDFGRRRYVPLPRFTEISVIDSVAVEAVHYLAVKEALTKSFESNFDTTLFSVLRGNTIKKSTVFIKGYPFLLVDYLERQKRSFSSKYEDEMFWNYTIQKFRQYIEVEVNIVTHFMYVAELNEELFDVYIYSSGIKLPPKSRNMASIKSIISGELPYYERHITFKFDRRRNTIDMWTDRDVAFVIELKGEINSPQKLIPKVYMFPLGELAE